MKKLLSLLFCLLLSIVASAQRPYTMTVDGKRATFTSAQVKAYFQKTIRERLKELNEQFPLQVDEYTTILSAIQLGKSIQFSYRVDIDRTDFTQEEINELLTLAKEVGKDNMKNLFQSFGNEMPPKEWKRFFVEIGLYYNYIYYDCNDRFFGRYAIYPKDLDLSTSNNP